MTISAKLLLVEDSPSLARTYRAQLEKAGHQVTLAGSLAEARECLAAATPDCVLMDLQLPDGNGLDLLQEWQNAEQAVLPVIVITANGSMNVAIEAMRVGASDFLVKPFGADRLLTTVSNVVDRLRLTRTVEAMQKSAAKPGMGKMVGASLAMQAVYKLVEAAARSSASVFITGESGTGKELAARAVHEQSTRAQKGFVALNCAALPKNLLESELFGHVKGAFTGATADRAGAAATANGGTLFLDEICEMDPDLQSALLRFIQLGEYRRVGEDRTRTADIRFVAATNRNPADEVRAGRFREDLFYRLHVIPLHMPPLRERGSDIGMLAEALLQQAIDAENGTVQGFTPAALKAMHQYAWPGNVRELENTIRRMVVMSSENMLSEEMVSTTLSLAPDPMRQPPPGETSGQTAPAYAHKEVPMGEVQAHDMEDIRPLWMTERDTIEGAIVKCGGNIQQAARLLGISPSTIYRKREHWQAQGRIAS